MPGCDDTNIFLLPDVARKGEQGGDGGGGEPEQPDTRRAGVPRQVHQTHQHNSQAILDGCSTVVL